MAIASGCVSSSASQSAQGPQTAAEILVTVSPRATTLTPAGQIKFTATVQGTSNSAVTWKASAGSIASDGTFTAPATVVPGQITITATSVSNSTQSATSLVTIQSASKLAIAGSSLSGVIANTPYDAALSATGGVPPYQWAISAGALPVGIALQSATGALAGTTTQTGEYSFTAKVSDSASNSATQSFTVAVAAAAPSGAFDGPAELPRVYLNTTLADTPAPGPAITVLAGGDLQTALNNANCGDTIELQAGATFTSGGTYGGAFTLPAKSCDDQHWIIIRTSAPDASLPLEGTRMTPCYAGVASLPGRPVFTCSSTQKVLATLTYAGTGDGPVVFANGANHYRLLGLEITRIPNNGNAVTALIGPALNGGLSQVVLDRLYIHGSPTDETRRGVDLTGATSMAVQDSYISEMHCRVGGTCTDSQAVSGGTGSLPMGPYKIDDNFLEAAGENLMFGGGAATQTPADIEVRFNHLFKPMFWLEGQPGYSAPAFIVKNHFEMKNAQRVLFDSNMVEDTWGGFSQHGASILIGPKNQDSGGESVCPLCQVTDVTVRFVTISHVSGAFQIANVLSPSGGAPLQGERYSIHDVIADDIQETKYIGYGNFAEIETIAQPMLQSVAINHVTAFPTHTMLSVDGPNTVKMPGFVLSNSIIAAATYPIWSGGSFGSSDCAYYDVPVKTVDLCFSEPTFAYNAFLGSSSAYPPSAWPSGNFFYSTAAIGFVNYNNGIGGDYHLLSSSPAKGKGSDGLDLGANVDAVLSAISGIE